MYRLTGNYGLAIVLLAILLKVLLLRLTYIQVRAMKVMQVIQPATKVIQERYKGKAQEMNKKLMELYKAFNANPFAGCLPLIIQMVILISLFQTLNYPQINRGIFIGESFLGIKLMYSAYINTAKKCVAYMPTDVPGILHLTESIHVYLYSIILVLIYVVSNFIMQRQMRGTTTSALAKQQANQMQFLNILIVVFGFVFSAVFLLFYVIYNIITAIEYTFILSRIKIEVSEEGVLKMIGEPPIQEEKAQTQRKGAINDPRTTKENKGSRPSKGGGRKGNRERGRI